MVVEAVDQVLVGIYIKQIFVNKSVRIFTKGLGVSSLPYDLLEDTVIVIAYLQTVRSRVRCLNPATFGNNAAGTAVRY